MQIMKKIIFREDLKKMIMSIIIIPLGSPGNGTTEPVPIS